MVGSRLTTHTYFTLVGPCRAVCLPVVHNWPHKSPSVIPKRRTYIVDSPSTRLLPDKYFFQRAFQPSTVAFASGHTSRRPGSQPSTGSPWAAADRSHKGSKSTEGC